MALPKLGTGHVALAAAGDGPVGLQCGGYEHARRGRALFHRCLVAMILGTTQRPEHLVPPPAFATCGPAGRLGALLGVPAAPGARQVEGPSASETHGGHSLHKDSYEYLACNSVCLSHWRLWHDGQRLAPPLFHGRRQGCLHPLHRSTTAKTWVKADKLPKQAFPVAWPWSLAPFGGL